MQARPNLASPITFNESNKLLQDIEHGKITYDKALERIDNICSDIETIINQKSINLNQVEVINTLFMVDEIFTGNFKSIEANSKDTLEVYKENSDRKTKNRWTTRHAWFRKWRIGCTEKKPIRTRTHTKPNA